MTNTERSSWRGRVRDFKPLFESAPAPYRAGPRSEENGDGSPRPLVLVVEDSRAMNQLICATLAADVRVESAFDGREGLDRALALRPDLVLCDVMMPELSGAELVRALRARHDMDTMPIIVLSGLADEKLRVRMLLDGANDYLTKPFSDAELRARVGNLVGARRAAMQLELQAAIADTMAEGVALVRADDRVVVYANPTLESMFGYDAGGLPGQPASVLYAPRGSPDLLAEVTAAVALDGSWNGELQVNRRDGTPIWCQANIATLEHGEHGIVWVSVFADVSARKRAEDKFRALLESAPDAIVIVDEAREIALINARTEQLFGYGREELVGCPLEILLPEWLPTWHDVYTELDAAETGARTIGVDSELYARRRDGSEFPVEISLSTLEADEGTLVSAAIRDVTERRQLELHRRRAAIVQHAEDAIFAETPEGVISEWNLGAARLYGYAAQDAIGRSAAMLIAPERAGEEEEILRRVLRGESMEQYEAERVRKDGSRVQVSLTTSPIRDDHGAVVAISTIARDITERKRYEGQLQYLADHDPLTGLFNRRRFGEELARELARARRYGNSGAVLAIDLDHFKYINDSLGHAVGDELIGKAGAIFRHRLRDTDVLARVGGDEFAVILPAVTPDEAERVAQDLLQAVRDGGNVETLGGSRSVTASVGIAPFSAEHSVTSEELVVEADIAMYDAKDAGRDRLALYNPAEDRQTRMQARLEWAERIRSALHDGRFVLHAQTILALNGDPAPRHELLLRMVGDDGDVIPPGVFVYIAEKMGLIQEIDRWVLHQAAQLLGSQQRAGNDVRLAINLSARTIADADLADQIATELKAAGADGRGLCLEVTETAAIVNVERAKRFAQQLNKLGCEFALDDFGAGFASFYYLKHLTFDYIKIDGEFIQNLARNRTDQLVVRSMVDIARGLGKRTIAEYVSTPAALELVTRYGVDYAQGFHIAKPAPLETMDLAQPALRGA